MRLATSLQLYMSLMSLCILNGSMRSLERTRAIANSSFSIRLLIDGSHRVIIESGKISGIPPTRVLTTCKLQIEIRLVKFYQKIISSRLNSTNPQLAASKIAIQNASVRDVLRNMCPLTKMFRTL